MSNKQLDNAIIQAIAFRDEAFSAQLETMEASIESRKAHIRHWIAYRTWQYLHKRVQDLSREAIYPYIPYRIDDAARQYRKEFFTQKGE